MSTEDNLIKLARDTNPEVRAAAIRELGLVTNADFAPILLDALEDPAWEVRAEAVRSLAKQGTPAVIPALQPLLEDDAVEVRRVTRDSLRFLRQMQRSSPLIREAGSLQSRERADIKWPAWMGKVEISFANVASIFMLISTVRFLTVNVWADQIMSDALWDIILICLILGIFLFVFVIAGILQVHLRLREFWSLLKEKPWRRLVELIFVVDVAGYITSDFLGQIIFLVCLTAGIPLAIAFFASELWSIISKSEGKKKSEISTL